MVEEPFAQASIHDVLRHYEVNMLLVELPLLSSEARSIC